MFRRTLIIILGIGLVVIAFYYKAKQDQFMRVSIKTTGKIKEVLESRDQDGSTLYTTIITFQTKDNQIIEKKSKVSTSRYTRKAGDNIEVYYDPQNPHNNLLDPKSTFIWFYLSTGIGGIFILAGIFGRRRSRVARILKRHGFD